MIPYMANYSALFLVLLLVCVVGCCGACCWKLQLFRPSCGERCAKTSERGVAKEEVRA